VGCCLHVNDNVTMKGLVSWQARELAITTLDYVRNWEMAKVIVAQQQL